MISFEPHSQLDSVLKTLLTLVNFTQTLTNIQGHGTLTYQTLFLIESIYTFQCLKYRVLSLYKQIFGIVEMKNVINIGTKISRFKRWTKRNSQWKGMKNLKNSRWMSETGSLWKSWPTSYPEKYPLLKLFKTLPIKTSV